MNQCVETLLGHDGYVNSVILLRDGRIASCSSDKTIKIWDLNKKIWTVELNGHSNFIRSIIQLKDGKIASCSNDQKIILWE